MNKNILASVYIDCSKITFEEFLWNMKFGFNRSVKKYHDEEYPKWVISNYERMNETIARKMNIAEKKAAEKYKSDRGRDNFLKKEHDKIAFETVESLRKDKFFDITFFDFDVEPWMNGIHGCCIMTEENINSENCMKNCWEVLKDNKYFRSAKGWHYVNYPNSRPQIELMLPEDMEKDYKDEENKLAESIYNFYKNCHYCGD